MLLGIVRRSALTALHGLRVFVLSLAAHIPLLVLSIVSVALIPIGVGMLALPQVVTWTRLLTRSQREIARDWAGVDIARAYRPAPGRYTPWSAFRWVVTDPATWREMLWLLVGIPAGVLGLLALAIPFYGLEGTLGVALLIWLITDGYGYGAVWFMDNWGEALLSLPQGAVILTIGVRAVAAAGLGLGGAAVPHPVAVGPPGEAGRGAHREPGRDGGRAGGGASPHRA